MRSLRTLQDGATYHVTSKIDHDDMSLVDLKFKILFFSVVEKAKRKFHFRLWDLRIMGNHIHFLIKPGEAGNLSKIMQWIKCNFAKSWNKAHGRNGHVWGERFYSRITNNQQEDGLVAGAGVYGGEFGEGGACGAIRGAGVRQSISQAAPAN
ncbi:MAG: transposase [Treponema sp.]|nr:transposase [Treponema sp.]